MPFPDELGVHGVVVSSPSDSWIAEGAALAAELAGLVPAAAGVEHVGSTSVPGMPAKDCLDMMVVVHDLEGSGASDALRGAGYRRRPEPWNVAEQAAGRDWPKLVFAPPVDARSCNVHVRTVGSPTTRLNLLFREHLRARPDRAARWGELKLAIAAGTPDLASYGRIKQPAWHLLMELAEEWARKTGWAPASDYR